MAKDRPPESERRSDYPEIWGALARLRNLILLLIAVAVLLNGAIGGLALYNASRISQDEKGDARLSREAAYRLCERAMQERAELHAIATDYPPLLPRRRGRVENRLPIFNCTPNLAGGAARIMSIRDMREYVRQYKKGELDTTPGPVEKSVGRGAVR